MTLLAWLSGVGQCWRRLGERRRDTGGLGVEEEGGEQAGKRVEKKVVDYVDDEVELSSK